MKNRRIQITKPWPLAFPTGLESSFAGSAVNVQFMVKGSKKCAASGGWGYADFEFVWKTGSAAATNGIS